MAFGISSRASTFHLLFPPMHPLSADSDHSRKPCSMPCLIILIHASSLGQAQVFHRSVIPKNLQISSCRGVRVAATAPYRQVTQVLACMRLLRKISTMIPKPSSRTSGLRTRVSQTRTLGMRRSTIVPRNGYEAKSAPTPLKAFGASLSGLLWVRIINFP